VYDKEVESICQTEYPIMFEPPLEALGYQLII